MTHYKKALETAAPDDYFNQGYIRYRIGRIYRDHLVADSADITYFKDALRYFRLVPDSSYVFECLNDIGTSYYKDNRDSVQSYLDRAFSLARQLGEARLERRAAINIAKTTMFSSRAQDIAKVKNTVLPLLDAEARAGCPQADLCDLLMTACYTLARQNKTDSAVFFLNQLPNELPSPSYTSFRLLCLAEIARSRHDIDQYSHYSEEYRQHLESILKDDLQCKLRDVENRYDNATLKFNNERNRMMFTTWLLIALLALSVLIILLLLISHKASLRKRQLTDLESTMERLHDDHERLLSQLEANKTMGDHLKETLKVQVRTFGQLVDIFRKEHKDNPKKFFEEFKKSYSINQPDESFWTGIQAYADMTHGGIVDRAINENPSLSTSDIHFLGLCCLDLPVTVIMACMGYNDIHALYNKKRRLAQTMKMKKKFDDYILEKRVTESSLPEADDASPESNLPEADDASPESNLPDTDDASPESNLPDTYDASPESAPQ